VLSAFAVFSTAALVRSVIPQPIATGSQDPSIKYYPADSWGYAYAQYGFSKVAGVGGVLEFVFQNASNAEVLWRTPNATQSFEFWAFQRSDGGNASISFDAGPETVFDYYNQSSGQGEGPVLVYHTDSLSPQEHTVTIKNLFDARGTLNLGYGQLNVSC